MKNIIQLNIQGSNYKTEIMAGVATFLTMAYIILVNPVILGAAHMNPGAVFTATCLIAAFSCLLTGILSNYPIAVAPAMAMNVYFSYVVVQGLGYSWQTALGAVFISGLLFLGISATPLKKLLLESIPDSINVAIAAGLGLFIALLGLHAGGLVAGDKNTLLRLGNIHNLPVILCFSGFCIIAALDYLQIKAAIIIGIFITTIIGVYAQHAHIHGIVSLPPSIDPILYKLNLHGLWSNQGFAIIFAFFLVSIFDSTGTFVGVLYDTKLLAKNNNLARGLVAISLSNITAGMIGTSTCSPYCESAAGVKAGGRTGWTSVTIAVLFLLALFFAPLAKSIPSYATASALIFVGCLMIKNFKHFNWDDPTDTIPSVITAIMIPLSFSIAAGIGIGFISYVLIKLFTGKIRQIKLMQIGWAIIFMVYFYNIV